MGLARFVEPLHLPAVWSNTGMVLQLLGVVFVVPVVVGLATREFVYAALFGSTAAGAFATGRILSRRRQRNLQPKEALVVTALAYPIFALLSAIAFLPVAPYVDGVFESMSGFTTTGLTVMDVEDLPWTLLFFRAYAQWLGGAGIVVLSLVILFGPGKAAFRLYASEFGQRNIAGSVIATTRVVIRVYMAITVFGFLLLWASGMSFQDAILHALTAVSTGGFSSRAESIAAFTSPFTRGALMLLMILGAVSLPLYYLVLKRGIKRLFADFQLRALLLLSALAAYLFVIAHPWSAEGALASSFNAVSALTGTGLQIGDPLDWAQPAFAVAIVLMALGGSAGSTTGGIKLLRLIVITQFLRWMVLKRLLPQEAAVPLKYGRIVIPQQEFQEILGVVGLFSVTILGSAIALTYAGFPMDVALFEATSAVGTVGLSAGIASPDLNVFAKLLLTLDMWAGRLEIVPLLVLASQGPWKWRWRGVTGR